MDIRSFLLGRGDFKSVDQIIDLVRSHARFEPAREEKSSAEALLIFQTSKQQTWLVATPRGLYCVLDDLNKGSTRVQWAIPSTELISDGTVTAKTSARDKSERTGLLDVNGRRDWLFSKKLFAAKRIEASVRDLISKAMT
ncbi:MAG TPA: hypothetical protein VI485_02310 [Vicinamibacterales bacterium]|nr:hypothetical protein [Vicinamibacterales bacterium]